LMTKITKGRKFNSCEPLTLIRWELGEREGSLNFDQVHPTEAGYVWLQNSFRPISRSLLEASNSSAMRSQNPSGRQESIQNGCLQEGQASNIGGLQ
jgi:hypothetical protein